MAPNLPRPLATVLHPGRGGQLTGIIRPSPAPNRVSRAGGQGPRARALLYIPSVLCYADVEREGAARALAGPAARARSLPRARPPRANTHARRESRRAYTHTRPTARRGSAAPRPGEVHRPPTSLHSDAHRSRARAQGATPDRRPTEDPCRAGAGRGGPGPSTRGPPRPFQTKLERRVSAQARDANRRGW